MSELGLEFAESVEQAVSGASVVVCPMPGLAVDGSLFAPHAPAPIMLTREVLSLTQPGAQVLLGRDTAGLVNFECEAQVRICEMGHDDVLQVQHAIPTAEAAVALAISSTEETLGNSAVAVVGYGRIGQLLARFLSGFGTDVTVAARREESRVRAASFGHRTVTTEAGALKELMSAHDIIFVTAAAQLIDRNIAVHGRRGSLVIDLVSPPGGCDHDVLRQHGVTVKWARAQADSAARHSARAQYQHIASRIGQTI
jgi:dipicolinate synthase subunit A